MDKGNFHSLCMYKVSQQLKLKIFIVNDTYRIDKFHYY